MAKHKAKSGIIKVGGAIIASIRSITVNESAETIDTTCLNDDYKTSDAGTLSWDMAADLFYHESDVAQGALAIGNTVTVGYYPIGEAAGKKFMSGSAIVTSKNLNNAQDGMVEGSITLTGTGPLTEQTV